MAEPLSLLLVEDSEDDALFIVRQLRRASYDPDLHRVETAEELAESLQRGGWDLVICDYLLPRLDGLTALRQTKAHDPDLPVILVSGKIGEDVAVEAMRAGASDYVMKDNLTRLGGAVSRELADVAVRKARRAAEQALAESEVRYRAIVEDQTEFVVRWRPDGTRTFVNLAYSRLLRRPRQELIGTGFLELVHQEDQERIRAETASLTPESPATVAEHRALTPDGTVVWQEWAHRGLFDEDGRLTELQSVGRDITERRQAEEATRQQLLLVGALRDTAAALSSTLDLEEVLDRILENAGRVIPHDAASILFVEGDKMRVVRSRGLPPQIAEQAAADWRLGESEWTLVAEMTVSGRPVVLSDVRSDPRWLASPQVGEWVRSFVAAPIIEEAKVFGFLALFSSTKGFFSQLHTDLLEGFASQAATAVRNARLFEAVSRSQRELQRLATRVVQVHEEERRRISLELHDEVGQSLTAMIIDAEAIQSLLPGSVAEAADQRLDEIGELAKQTLRQIRDLSQHLWPALLDDLGLPVTVRWLVDHFGERTGLQLDLHTSGFAEERLDPDLEIVLYRVIQEALNNIARHAKASAAAVFLERSTWQVTVRIEDDGVGFDVDSLAAAGPPHRGTGLVGVRERVTSVNGRLAIRSSPGEGTRLHVEVPL